MVISKYKVQHIHTFVNFNEFGQERKLINPFLTKTSHKGFTIEANGNKIFWRGVQSN